MRRLACALVLLAGCKQVLDIPDNVTSVADGFHVGGTATGIAGASMPVLEYGNGKTFTLDHDGEFALPDLIGDGEAFQVTAVIPASCDVQNGQGKVASSAITSIVVTCDGFAALSSLGFSAPLDDLAAMGSTATIAGSLLTQQTSLTPLPLHAEASVSSLLRDGTTIANGQGTFGPLALTTATTLQVTVTNATAPAPRTMRDYIVTVDPTHAPAQFAFRKPGTAEAGAHFGTMIAMDGTTLAIGEPDHSGGGQVRVLHRTGTTWLEDPPLHGDAGSTTFGAALAVVPGVVIVGAPGEAGGGGGVYVFKSGTLDSHLAGAPGSQLGAAIATDGTRVIVGAPGAAGGGAIFTGTVSSTGGVSLVPASTSIVHHAGDRFGAAVAVGGGIFVVGAPGEASASTTDPSDASYPGAGAAYAFATPTSAVTYLKATTPGAGDAFGSSVAIDGDAQHQTILVGAPLEDSASTDPANNAADAAGAAYAFAGTFASVATPSVSYLKSPHPAAGDGFGTSVALRGGVAVIGAPYENVNGTHDAGAAYVYRTAQLATTQAPAALTAATPGESDAFGAALSLTLEALAVGAPHESSLELDSGAVYGFR